jgi:hypothetical protein
LGEVVPVVYIMYSGSIPTLLVEKKNSTHLKSPTVSSTNVPGSHSDITMRTRHVCGEETARESNCVLGCLHQ